MPLFWGNDDNLCELDYDADIVTHLHENAIISLQLCVLLEKLELAAALLQYPLADCLNSLLATMTECNNAILFATLMKVSTSILLPRAAYCFVDFLISYIDHLGCKE